MTIFVKRLVVIKHWWKFLAIIFLSFAFVKGLLGDVPRLNILNETIRNLYFHVGMWFGMIALMTGSLVYAILQLTSSKIEYSLRSAALAHAGILYGILGLLTGMLWGQYTWGYFWPDDPKIHGAAVTVLIYLAYFILRSSIEDQEKRNSISGAYNIFAYFMLVIFLIIYPRIAPSLHPGNGGNPGFNTYDLDNNMRMVFYPAILGWILLGFWIGQLKFRVSKIKNIKLIKMLANEN